MEKGGKQIMDNNYIGVFLVAIAGTIMLVGLYFLAMLALTWMAIG